jgi:DNA repair exonuclease SbcCD nuclease subunit
MPRFLFMADAHIKPRTWTNNPQIQGDAYAALDKVAGLGNLPDTLVIGGDWFDTQRPSSMDMSETVRFAKNFNRVFYIKGNHDKSEPNWLSVIEHAEQLTLNPVDIGDAKIMGADWTPDEEALQMQFETIYTEASKLGADDLLYVVVHQPSKHLLGFDGAWKLDFDVVAKSMEDYSIEATVVFLIGDIHLNDTTVFGDIIVHSPGCLYPLTEDAVDKLHGVTIVDGTEMHHETVPVREYHSVEYTTDKELRAYIADAEACAKESGMLPPRISVMVPDGVKISTDKAVILNTVHEEAPTMPGEEDRKVVECTMEAAIAQACGKDRTLRKLALAVFASEDPVKCIEGWLKFWKVVRG